MVFPIYIVAIAATTDGQRIAVAGANRCYLYERDAKGGYLAQPLEAAYVAGEFIHALAFTPDGRRLLIGRETPQGGQAELLTLEGSKRIVWKTNHAVEACTTSEGRLAFAAGSDIYLVNAGAAEAKPVLLAGGSQVDDVAFLQSEEKASNRLRVRSGKQSRVIDPRQQETIELWTNDRPLPPAAEPGRRAAGWSFEPSTLTVRKQGRVLLRLPLDAAREGGVAESAWCWVKGPGAAPRAIAIGTNLSGAILVYDLQVVGDRPKLLRKFVGHEGGVTSLAARPDGELLASGSDDGSASLWSLAGTLRPKDDAERLLSIWGVRLVPNGSGGCRVAELATQGPFFNRGVRVGDRIDRLKWRERGPLLEADSYEAIVSRLSAEVPSGTQAAIYADVIPTERAGNPFGLNFLPIWGPLISFYGEGESWVAWTPTGHYDASIGGDRLIGWQFNERQGVAPSFATAQQHHKTFRKPDLIRQLLGAEDEVVVKAIEQTLQKQTVDNDRLPEVRVAEEKVEADGRVTVSVEVVAPEGETVDEVALINAEGRKIDRMEGPFIPGERVDLKIDPVDGSAQEITARVYGSSGTADSKETVRYQPDVELKEKLEKLPQAQSVLYLLAVGVSRYEDSVGVEQLAFAEADAKHVAETFERHPAYDRVMVRLLTTADETTGASIREGLRWLREAADGNDTIGLFFAGHSRVEKSEVSLLSSDGDTAGLASAELIDRCFDRSIGRKVLILDSCNSGRFREAIRAQTQRSDDADVGVSLFASCAADELAREDPETGSGVFTNLIVRGLGGAAGRRSGDTVSDIDLAGFLRRDEEAVSRFSASLQKPVLYIPFAFDRDSDLWLTRPGS